jgi:hypothetical protein
MYSSPWSSNFRMVAALIMFRSATQQTRFSPKRCLTFATTGSKVWASA